MSGAVINVSVKDSAGALFAVGGMNYDDFYQNLIGLALGDVEMVDDYLADWKRLLFNGTVQQASENFTQAGMVEGSQQSQGGGGQQGYSQQQGGQTSRGQAGPPPGSDAPSCVHGPRQFISGTAQNGKPWKAWACPLPKERRSEQCDKVWIR